MADPYPFAVDVLRAVCDRLVEKTADLAVLVAAAAPFDGWLAAEAFLACRRRQSDAGWCEVAARPTYGGRGMLPGTARAGEMAAGRSRLTAQQPKE